MLSKILTFPWGRLVCLWMIFYCTIMSLDGENLPASILAVGFLFAFVALYGIAVFRGIKARSE